MRIEIYSRDESGIVSGPSNEDGWESVQQMLAYYFRADEAPEPEDMIGWPHSRVIWYGSIGVAEESMQIDRLARAGKTMFGDRWQSDLARAIDVGDRRVRQWISGDRGIPAGVWADIATLLSERSSAASRLLAEIESVVASTGRTESSK